MDEALFPGAGSVGDVVVALTPDMVVRYDLAMRRTYANASFERLTGLARQDYLGKLPSEHSTIGPNAILIEAGLRSALASGEPQSLDIEWRAADGRLLWHSARIIVERDAEGRPSGLLLIACDVTSLKRAEEQWKRRERHFRALVEESTDLIAKHDRSGRRIYVNPALAAVLAGRAARSGNLDDRESPLALDEERYERLVRSVLANGEGQQAELRYLRADGSAGWLDARLCAVAGDDGMAGSVFVVARDISDWIEQRDRLKSLALTDSLTRLHNRQALYDYGPALISEAQRHSRRIGVMVLDIDRFKDVNDSLGPPAGDRLLCELAERLAQCTRGYDLLVRLGGDQFALVVTNLDDEWGMVAVADKVERALAAPVQLAGRQLVVGASLGIALFPADGEQIEDLVAHADAAMYHAKRQGGRRFEFYRAEYSSRARDRLAMEQALRLAQNGDGLMLVYQPVVSLRSGHIIGAEALLRWHHPEHGLLAPDRFIGLAEDSGLIVPIGRWILDQVMRLAVRTNTGRAHPLTFSLNVSARQILRDDLVAAIGGALERTGCQPAWLVLEVTESLLLDDRELVQQVFTQLHRMGLQIAIDDFGTGYSALNYLSRFEVQSLKIDRQFVRDIEGGSRQAELVKAFLGIAQALRLKVVAEGVETLAQADFLRSHGCSLAQGYLFYRPLPLGAFEEALLASDQGQGRGVPRHQAVGVR